MTEPRRESLELRVPEEERAETRRGCPVSVLPYLVLAVLVAWWLR